jgi:hypothetical protein
MAFGKAESRDMTFSPLIEVIGKPHIGAHFEARADRGPASDSRKQSALRGFPVGESVQADNASMADNLI